MPTIIAFMSATVLLTTGGPFNLDSHVPIGIRAEKKQFVAIERDEAEVVSKIYIRAYRAKRGKRAKVRIPAIVVDRTNEDSTAASLAIAETVREKANDWLTAQKITAADTLAGGLTGRFRLLEQGLVIAQKGDTLIIRSGDASVMKTNTLIKSLARTAGRCRGKAEGKVKHIALMTDWNALAAYVEATCTPEGATKPTRRITRLHVLDFAKATKFK